MRVTEKGRYLLFRWLLRSRLEFSRHFLCVNVGLFLDSTNDVVNSEKQDGCFNCCLEYLGFDLKLQFLKAQEDTNEPKL